MSTYAVISFIAAVYFGHGAFEMRNTHSHFTLLLVSMMLMFLGFCYYFWRKRHQSVRE